MDIGDIVGVTGPMKRTDKGELSIIAEDLQVCLSRHDTQALTLQSTMYLLL